MPYKDPIRRKEEAKARKRRWMADKNNRKRANAAARRVYALHPEKEQQRVKRWRAANPEKARNYRRNQGARWIKEHLENYRYSLLKTAARKRGLDCNLSFSDYAKLIGSRPCYYCGDALPPHGSGVDRINSDIGYVVGNIRPCCSKCNNAKRDMTEVEFKIWALRLTSNWAK